MHPRFASRAVPVLLRSNVRTLPMAGTLSRPRGDTLSNRWLRFAVGQRPASGWFSSLESQSIHCWVLKRPGFLRIDLRRVGGQFVVVVHHPTATGTHHIGPKSKTRGVFRGKLSVNDGGQSRHTTSLSVSTMRFYGPQPRKRPALAPSWAALEGLMSGSIADGEAFWVSAHPSTVIQSGTSGTLSSTMPVRNLR